MNDLERLVAVEERAKSNTKRLDEAERKIEDIHDLTYSIKELATETKRLREDVNKIDNRLNTLEEKPGKNWEDLMKTIITRNCNSSYGLFFSKNGNVEERENHEQRMV